MSFAIGILITGGNRGYGKAAAEDFLEHGARVIVACRSSLEKTKADLSSKGVVELLHVDMGEPSSVEELVNALAASEILKAGGQIDILVLNAAMVSSVPKLNANGISLMYAVNYLGNVVLVNVKRPDP